MWAAQEGRADVARLLLERGALTTTRDKVSHIAVRVLDICSQIDLPRVLKFFEVSISI
jgi:ankyrin repeat protein